MSGKDTHNFIVPRDLNSTHDFEAFAADFRACMVFNMAVRLGERDLLAAFRVSSINDCWLFRSSLVRVPRVVERPTAIASRSTSGLLQAVRIRLQRITRVGTTMV